MTVPFSLAGTLIYPPDAGQPQATRSFSGSGQFVSKQESDFSLTGTGTLVVSFGTVGAAKAILLELDATSVAAVTVHINGGTDNIEIAPGGFICYSNPAPGAGITSLSVAYTAAATGSIRILG